METSNRITWLNYTNTILKAFIFGVEMGGHFYNVTLMGIIFRKIRMKGGGGGGSV